MKISHIILTEIPKTMMTQDQILEVGVFQTNMMKTIIEVEVEADLFEADSDMMKTMVKIIHVHRDMIKTFLKKDIKIILIIIQEQDLTMAIKMDLDFNRGKKQIMKNLRKISTQNMRMSRIDHQ
jgi:predicted transport protein